jgi:hypothetical protein
MKSRPSIASVSSTSPSACCNQSIRLHSERRLSLRAQTSQPRHRRDLLEEPPTHRARNDANENVLTSPSERTPQSPDVLRSRPMTGSISSSCSSRRAGPRTTTLHAQPPLSSSASNSAAALEARPASLSPGAVRKQTAPSTTVCVGFSQFPYRHGCPPRRRAKALVWSSLACQETKG